MNILSHAIVSNSDMIKNYKMCRDKAELYGSVFILKNNQPNAVLFSIDKYESLSKLIE
jgi:PHD/YefM family antitoxin component YafN of YafNO toxin-antitoxin module